LSNYTNKKIKNKCRFQKKNKIYSKDEDEVVKLTNSMVLSDKDSVLIRTLNNAGENFLTEAGLYGLVMVSRKPQAKAFKRWVKHEVLPSIRKHGTYSIDYDKIQWNILQFSVKYRTHCLFCDPNGIKQQDNTTQIEA